MIFDRLIEKIQKCNNPTVVGLDPKIDFIPKYILDENFELYGQKPKAIANAFFDFNKKIIDEVYDLVPAVKPQIAMYEMYGSCGIKAYIRTIEYAKSKNLIVIGDVKRGDIQSTAEAYSDGHIGQISIGDKKTAVFDEDIITVNPYLGGDSIIPYLKNCEDFDRGLFILVKTSNPMSGDFQDLDVGGMKLYEKVGLTVAKWGENLIGENGFSALGAVVGATYKEEAEKLRKLLPNTFFLVPGYGAQGGKAEDLAVFFNQKGLGAIINNSRGIIAAYKNSKDFSENEFEKASRQAVLDMKSELLKYINL